MDINEIKKEIYSNYMQVAYTMMSSDEYKKYRKIGIWIFVLIILIMIAVCFLLIKYILIPSIFVEVHNHAAKKIIGYIWVITFFVLYAPFYLHHSFYINIIKIRYMKKIIPDLLNVRYYHEESKDEACILHDSEIKNSNIVKDYDDKSTDDIFFGNYKGIEYNIQEIKLIKHRKNLLSEDRATVEFDGMVLKADVKTGINGWIEFSTTEMENSINWSFSYNFTMYFLIIFIILAFVLLIMNAAERLSPIFDSFPFAAAVTLAIFALIVIAGTLAYSITKILNIIESKKQNYKIKQRRSSSIADINEQFDIKASDNIKDINGIITQELAAVIDELKFLFKTEMIKCIFCNDKIILAIKSKENMFEMGGLFTSPTNKKVAERFIAQMSGIILFLDYISNINQN